MPATVQRSRLGTAHSVGVAWGFGILGDVVGDQTASAGVAERLAQHDAHFKDRLGFEPAATVTPATGE